LRNKQGRSTGYNAPIIWASEEGHTEIIRLLLEEGRVNLAADNNAAIRYATICRKPNAIRFLLSKNGIDPGAEHNEAIRHASYHGHIESFRLLLADNRVDPAADDNVAVRLASENGHKDIIHLLLEIPKVFNLAASSTECMQNETVKGFVREKNLERIKPLLHRIHRYSSKSKKNFPSEMSKKIFEYLQITK